MIRALRTIVRFWVDFVIGDDWTIAAAVAAGLVAAGILAAAGDPAWWPLPVAVLAAILLSLRRAVARGA
jgi:hypothetical protein